jgi:capsular polysaccharide biosynthesis protein
LRPRLSIILAAHPPGGEIQSRLDDLRKLLRGKKGVEVLLADYSNGSPCFFRALANKLPPGWRYFFFPELDFAAARVAAARRAQGARMIFLDPRRIPASVWRGKIRGELMGSRSKHPNQISPSVLNKRIPSERQAALVSPTFLAEKRNLFRQLYPKNLKQPFNQDLAWPTSSRPPGVLPGFAGTGDPGARLLRSRWLGVMKRFLRVAGFRPVEKFVSLHERGATQQLFGILRLQKVFAVRCRYADLGGNSRPAHPRLADEETFLSPPGFRVEMGEAKVFGPTPAVCDAHNQLIVEASGDWGKKPEQLGISRNLFPPSCKRVSGSTFLSACLGAETYFHWMTDTLPMLLREQQITGRLARFENFLMHPHIKRFHWESLEALGLDPKKVKLLEKGRGYRCEKLIFHTPHHVSGRPPAPVLKKVAGLFFRPDPGRQNSFPRLAIFRKGVQSRSFLHPEELEEVLSRRGFIFYDPEQHSIQEQARMFHGARVVLAAHGSALTNLIFCRRGTKVIELFSSRYVNPCYRHIAQQLGLEHLPVLDSLNNADPVTHLSDSGARIAISGRQLARVLDSCLGPAQG